MDNPVHPRELLATIYHCVGINPGTLVRFGKWLEARAKRRQPGTDSSRSCFHVV